MLFRSRGGRVSGFGTVAAFMDHYRAFRAKERDLERWLRESPVDVVVTDSEYATGPARRRGIPVIGLNNADLVVSECLGDRPMPRGIHGHFWLVEYPDYLLHRARCDAVISPAPLARRPRHPRIRPVGLILRRAVRSVVPDASSPFPSPNAIRSVVFMLSGSNFASRVNFGDEPLPFHVDVVGIEGTNRPGVTYHGRLMNNLELLRRGDALVVNGGFSAVSEAIALNKPTFVIPVPGHAEQAINARMVADLGRGYVTTASEIVPLLRRLASGSEWTGLAARVGPVGMDGASEGAALIREWISKRVGRPGGGRPREGSATGAA